MLCCRPFDVRRKRKIAAISKGLRRVSIPTCDVQLVGKVKARSEAAVVLGCGSQKGYKKVMALRDGTVLNIPESVVNHNKIAKRREEFAKKHCRWGTHYCTNSGCKVCMALIHIPATHTSHTHTHTHTCTHTHTHTHTHAHAHICRARAAQTHAHAHKCRACRSRTHTHAHT